MRRAAGSVFVLMLLVLQVAYSAASSAAGGTWGAGGYAYASGLVCTTATPDGLAASTPLAAWDVGDGTLGYLTSSLTSDGAVDSGAPPLASVGGQIRTPVAVGTAGFATTADIATYAKLLSALSPSDGTAARIASAVLAKTSVADPTAPTVPGCAGDPAALLRSAAALAGPYKLSLSPQPTPVDPGATGELVATVLSRAGHPVPGMVVTADLSGAPLTSATTDASGHAKLSAVVPAGTTTASMPVTASLSATIGLVEVSATGNSTASNPTAQVASALSADAPVTVTAHAALPVMLGADPTITASSDHTGLVLGSQLTPQAVIGGMHGHSADVTFTIYGPVKPPASGTCGKAKFSAKSPAAGYTAAVTTIGDQTLHAGSWAPTETGCYLVHASLATTDAKPVASADSGYGDPLAMITVVDVRARLAAAQTLTGAGPLNANVTVTGGGSAAASIRGALAGPVRPDENGSCAGVDFAHAPHVATSATSPDEPADATTTRYNLVTGKDVARGGCYQWLATISLAVGPGSTGTVSVPVGVTTAPVLLLVPTIRLSSDEVSTTKPNPVAATVIVTGLYQQPAHVALQMHYAAANLHGCRDADWATTGVSASGPPTDLPTTSGVLTRSVSTGELGTMGCWLPVAVLTLDENPAVSVQTPLANAGQAILAGITLQTVAGPGPTERDAVVTDSWSRVVVAGGSFAALTLVAVGCAFGLAWRSRHRQALAAGPIELPGTLAD